MKYSLVSTGVPASKTTRSKPVARYSQLVRALFASSREFSLRSLVWAEVLEYILFPGLTPQRDSDAADLVFSATSVSKFETPAQPFEYSNHRSHNR